MHSPCHRDFALNAQLLRALAATVTFTALTLLGWAATCAAQAADATPVGLWLTIDDTSGKARSHVRVYEQDSALFGKIEKIIIPGKTDRCVLCTDERRDQPALGLVIIRKMKKSTDTPVEWNGGDILDPEKGAVYTGRMQLSDDGQTLNVRGYIGIPLLGRSQTWTRVKP